MKGYGYKLDNEHIAVGTWAQLARNRTEIGPAAFVISQLFDKLKLEEDVKVKFKPIPITIAFADVTLDFKDIWFVREE